MDKPSRKKRTKFIDDGRVIAPMNVDGMRWYTPKYGAGADSANNGANVSANNTASGGAHAGAGARINIGGGAGTGAGAGVHINAGGGAGTSAGAGVHINIGGGAGTSAGENNVNGGAYTVRAAAAPIKMSRGESRAFTFGVMKAVLLVTFAFVGVFFLFILFCIYVWFK